jgi:hypothetical protein
MLLLHFKRVNHATQYREYLLFSKGGGFCPPMKGSHVTLRPTIAQKLSTSKTLDYELRERKERDPHQRDA